MGLGQVPERKISTLKIFLIFWFLLIIGYQFNEEFALIVQDGSLSWATMNRTSEDFQVQYQLMSIPWTNWRGNSRFIFQSILFLSANWGIALGIKSQKTTKDLLRGILAVFLLVDAINFYLISGLSGKAFDAFEYYGATVLDFFRLMPVLPIFLQWLNNNTNESS